MVLNVMGESEVLFKIYSINCEKNFIVEMETTFGDRTSRTSVCNKTPQRLVPKLKAIDGSGSSL